MKEVAERLIRPILKLIPEDGLLKENLPNLVVSESPDLNEQQKINNLEMESKIELMIEALTCKQFRQEQDEQVVKFLK